MKKEKKEDLTSDFFIFYKKIKGGNNIPDIDEEYIGWILGKLELSLIAKEAMEYINVEKLEVQGKSAWEFSKSNLGSQSHGPR